MEQISLKSLKVEISVFATSSMSYRKCPSGYTLCVRFVARDYLFITENSVINNPAFYLLCGCI